MSIEQNLNAEDVVFDRTGGPQEQRHKLLQTIQGLLSIVMEDGKAGNCKAVHAFWQKRDDRALSYTTLNNFFKGVNAKKRISPSTLKKLNSFVVLLERLKAEAHSSKPAVGSLKDADAVANNGEDSMVISL